MVAYNINGRMVTAGEPVFPASSRGYRYGDGFFESMRYSNGRVLHGDLHFIRIRKSAMLLKMQLPLQFDRDALEARIHETAVASNMMHARVRCTFLRESAGFYAPDANDCSIVIELQPTDQGGFEWNERGLVLGAYREMCKNSNYTSMLKCTSSVLYVMASMYARENGYDECLIFNDMGRVAESSSSNIFCFNGEFLNTPPLSEYCVDGVMRKVVMNLAQEYGYTVIEQPISEVALNSADEVFITNASRGIRWVEFAGSKRYKHNVSKVLFERLNQTL